MSPKKMILLAALIVMGAAFSFCRKEKPEVISTDTAEVPWIPERTDPFPGTANQHLATLGRVLFYDQELSQNKNISCGSCHRQENAFTDNLRFSEGTNGGLTERNTPSIFAKFGRMFWDGRANSLEDLTLRPIRNKVEMNHPNINGLVTRIAQIDYYKALLEKRFPEDTRIDSNLIKAALAEFIRTFRFTNNRFHRSERGELALSPSEQRGRNLFFGTAKCGECHHIRDDFGNNGYGVTDESHNIGLDRTNPDAGVGAVTGKSSEHGSFMMPVLLNCELTAPYMHDGRFNTLEEVVEHYDSEIQENPNLDAKLKYWTGEPVKLNLTDEDKKALVDFLKALTDPSILTDPRYSNPFKPRAS